MAEEEFQEQSSVKTETEKEQSAVEKKKAKEQSATEKENVNVENVMEQETGRRSGYHRERRCDRWKQNRITCRWKSKIRASGKF